MVPMSFKDNFSAQENKQDPGASLSVSIIIFLMSL